MVSKHTRRNTLALLLQTTVLASIPTSGSSRPKAYFSPEILYDREYLMRLPVEGPAWDEVRSFARLPVVHGDLSNQDDSTNVRTLARALYALRMNDDVVATEVRKICSTLADPPHRTRVLSVARELGTYVIAADTVGLDSMDHKRFKSQLTRLQNRLFRGRSLRSTHEQRPNNWGTHAGATRILVASYLKDNLEIQRAAHVFRGWLGEPGGWKEFEFGRTWWQPKNSRLYGIVPQGMTLNGHSIDGVLPDDMRRAGPFRWPPPKENYVYEALQGALLQAILLDRIGYDAWQWGNRALLRAFTWLYDEANYAARGDDAWMVFVINAVYGTNFPTHNNAQPGKSMGFTDWLYTGSDKNSQP